MGCGSVHGGTYKVPSPAVPDPPSQGLLLDQEEIGCTSTTRLSQHEDDLEASDIARENEELEALIDDAQLGRCSSGALRWCECHDVVSPAQALQRINDLDSQLALKPLEKMRLLRKLGGDISTVTLRTSRMSDDLKLEVEMAAPTDTHIQVCTITGECVHVQIGSQDTIETTKARIRRLDAFMFLNGKDFGIVFDGKELVAQETIFECGLQKGSQVLLVLRGDLYSLPGLVEAFREASLHEKASRALRWCEEMGVVALQEALDHVDSLCASVQVNSLGKNNFAIKATRSSDAIQSSLKMLLKLGSDGHAHAIEILAKTARQDCINTDAIRESGGILALLKAMTAHEYSAPMQELGCQALSSIAARCKDSRREIGIENGISIILTALNKHTDAPAVQFRACQALLSSCYHSHTNSRQFVEQGGVDAVANAMKLQRTSNRLQTLCCTLFIKVAKGYTNSRSVILQRSSEIGRVVKEFSYDVDALTVSVDLLATLLCSKNVNCKATLGEGIITCVRAAMANHPNASELQFACCRLMRNLTALEKKWGRGEVATCVSEILRAMRTCENHVPLLCNALRALRATSHRSDTCALDIVAKGAITTAMSVMRTHLQSAELVTQGMGLLVDLASVKGQNYEVYLAAIPVAESARAAHPKDRKILDQVSTFLRVRKIR